MAVGFFTQGIAFELPHPRVPQRTILLLCFVISKAWQLLSENPPENFDLRTADEDTITQVLVEIIENRLRITGEIDGFDAAHFGKVTRDPKKTNYNKEHPDKMPDIFFDLKREKLSVFSEQDGLFVECKPIDSRHPILSCYCNMGLIRFVNGDYAWAMKDALMVGYVSGRFSFKRLKDVLNDKEKNAALKTTNHSEDSRKKVYNSNHKRTFDWFNGRGQACPISVTHLWLHV